MADSGSRGERRARTRRVALRRWHERQRNGQAIGWGGRGRLSVWGHATHRPWSCRCGGRIFGNPKVGGNGCSADAGEVRRAVRQRIAGRRLCRDWLAVTGSWLDCEL